MYPRTLCGHHPEVAKNGGPTIADKDIANTIYTLVYNTGMFYNDCNK